MRTLRGSGLLLPLAALACGGVEPIVECTPAGGVEVFCGFQRPEDLAVIPGEPLLVVSQMGTMDGAKPGSIALFDLRSHVISQLYPAGGPGATPEPETPGPLWGDPGCPGPPGAAFAPHGIDLAQRSDGQLQLLVVNHGGRESVEFFELTRPAPALHWRGCALSPETGAGFNDVVSLRSGGFLVTKMVESQGFTTLVRGLLGLETGAVLEWEPGRGHRELPGTRGSFPNGIEISGDEETIYLDLYGSNEVRKIARATGVTLASAAVSRPDNVTWAADGRLFVASHKWTLLDFPSFAACNQIERGSCPVPFDIVAVDPESFAQQVVYAGGGPPMGAGTVAVQVSSDLYLGSFTGDRIARVPLHH